MVNIPCKSKVALNNHEIEKLKENNNNQNPMQKTMALYSRERNEHDNEQNSIQNSVLFTTKWT